MTMTEKAVQAVEGGLLTANRIKGRPQEQMTLQERMTYYRVPGFSIALIDQGEIAWTQGYGLMEAGSDRPVTADTIFQAASVSKTVTAVTVLSLVEAGVLDLDADVNEGLTSWQVPESEYTGNIPVTLSGLLSHTAGLSVSGYRGYPNGSVLPTITQILNGEPPAACDPVDVMQPPGQGFNYSGGGYVVIEQLIEDVTGKSLAEHAQELVFDKLGMTNSTFEHFLPEKYLPQAATAHLDDGRPVPGKWHIYPEHAPASLWSTPTDLSRLIVEIFKSYRGESGLILSPEMTRQMLTPYVDWVGLGYPIFKWDNKIRFEHPGWNEGFHSLYAGCPDTGQGVVWMANGENGKLLGNEVMRGLVKVFDWSEYESVEKSPVQVEPAVLARYAGKYRYVDYPDFGVEIVLDDEGLLIQETPIGLRYRIYPESETEFFSIHSAQKITFSENEEGKTEILIGHFVRLERVE